MTELENTLIDTDNTNLSFFWQKDNVTLMSAKHQNTHAKDQKIILIFPFSYKSDHKFNIQNFRSNLIRNSWEKDNYITHKSRFYEYIMDVMGAKESSDSIALRKPINWIKNKIYNVFLNNSKIKMWQPAMGGIKHVLTSLALYPDETLLYLFSSNIAFYCISFSVTSTKAKSFSQYMIWDLLYLIKQTIKTYEMHKFVLDQLTRIMGDTEFEFFEQKEVVNNANNIKEYTIRASIFTNFSFITTDNIDNSKIPDWVIGKSVLKCNAPLGRCEDSYSLVEGNIIKASVEGCCVCNYVNKPNGLIGTHINANIWSYCQHTFVSYLLCLHQLFFLHYMQKKINNINLAKFNKRSLQPAMEEIETKCSYFNTNYIYNQVSSITRYQGLYAKIKNSLQINDFMSELDYSLNPTNNVISKGNSRQNSILLNIMNALAVVNVVLAILDFINISGKCSGIFKLLSALAAGAMFFVMVLLFFIPKRKWRDRRNKNRRK